MAAVTSTVGALTLTDVFARTVMPPPASITILCPAPDLSPATVMATVGAPVVSSNSSRLPARVLMTRRLLVLSGGAGSVVVPFHAAPRIYGRSRSPASKATTTMESISGSISKPWSSSAYGVTRVAQAVTFSPSDPSHGSLTCTRPCCCGSGRSVTRAGYTPNSRLRAPSGRCPPLTASPRARRPTRSRRHRRPLGPEPGPGTGGRVEGVPHPRRVVARTGERRAHPVQPEQRAHGQLWRAGGHPVGDDERPAAAAHLGLGPGSGLVGGRRHLPGAHGGVLAERIRQHVRPDPPVRDLGPDHGVVRPLLDRVLRVQVEAAHRDRGTLVGEVGPQVAAQQP